MMVQQMFKTLFKSKEMSETLTRSNEMHKTLSVSKTIEIKGKLRNSNEIMGMISELISRMLSAPSVRMLDSSWHQNASHTSDSVTNSFTTDNFEVLDVCTQLCQCSKSYICNRVNDSNLSERLATSSVQH